MSTDAAMQATKAAPLSVQLFGSVFVTVNGEPLPPLRSRKGLWLLALLTLRKGKPVERELLVGALWPDSSQTQALSYLRHCLTELRHALGTEALRLQSPTRQTLSLDLEDAEVDVLIFDAGISQRDLAALSRSVAVYRGPLLDGCAEEWVLSERGSREQSYLAALRELADDASARGDPETAIGYARRAIEVDPLQEGAQRVLMQALASTGDHGAAVQAYRNLRLYLHSELKAEPSAETTELYSRLRRTAQPSAQPRRDSAQTRTPTPCRLPRPLTELLGRDEEVAKVASLLRQRRLLTLTGTGGLGKTRLAIAVAEVLADEHAHGAWFVELAGLSDPTLVIQSVATSLGVADESGRTMLESLATFLEPRLLLLVLDNCEHLLPACGQLAADLLGRCRGLRILATSRQALGITGEMNWPLPLLPVPNLANLPTDPGAVTAHLNEFASVQLFVDRAEATNKDFALSDGNALSVAQICVRLDGIPLALELAAGNAKVLSVEQISHRLDDAFRLLTRGNRTALPRQQTLQATLDWSYDLLTERERLLLQRLSVFADGWTLETVDKVCASEPDLESGDLFDVLTSLVDKSLVQVAERGRGMRYRMLETVRQYARGQLSESGHSEELQSRHGKTFLALAEASEPKLRDVEQGEWLQLLEEEHENLLAALDWSLAEPETGAVLRFCTALTRFWSMRGHLSEGREWCLRVLGKVEGRDRAKVLDGIGKMAYHQGDYASSQDYYQESLNLYREIADRSGIAQALNGLGNAACNLDDYSAARAYYQQSLMVNLEICDLKSEADSNLGLGRVAEFQSHLAESRDHYGRSLDLCRQMGDHSGIASSLSGLGNAAYYRTDYDAAQANYRESLEISRQIGDRGGIAYAINGLGIVAWARGEDAAAWSYYEESLAIYREIGDRRGIAYLLDDMGRLTCGQSDLDSALRYCEESLAICQAIGDRMGVACVLGTLGRVSLAQGDHAAARKYRSDSLVIERDIGNRYCAALSLEAIAVIAVHAGAADEAAILGGAAEVLREDIGSPRSPLEQEAITPLLASLSHALGDEAFSIAWEKGRTMKLETAIAKALSEHLWYGKL